MSIPENLLKAVREGTVVPFVGSGLSVSVKWKFFPDWSELIGEMAEELRKIGAVGEAAAAKVEAERAAGRLPEAAEIACRSLGADQFNPLIERRFGQSEPPEGANLAGPAALWRMKPPLIVTTNYDSVLEWPVEGAPASPRRVHNDDLSALTRIEGGEPLAGPSIWHLHGSARRPDTAILAESQYQQLYGPNQRYAYRQALKTLRHLITTRPLLYVGFSLDDPFVIRQLKAIRQLTGDNAPTSYMVVREGEADPADLLAEKKVSAVPFPGFGQPFFDLLDRIGYEALGGRPEPVYPGRPPRIPQPRGALVDELRDLLCGLYLPPEVIAEEFNRRVGHGGAWLPLHGDPRLHTEMAVCRLAELGAGSGGRSPLLELIRGLRTRLPDQTPAALDDWVDRAVVRFEAGGAVAPALCADEAEPYVLASLAESKEQPGHWRGQAWRWVGGRPEPLFEGEQLYETAELATTWPRDLVNRIKAAGPRGSDVTLAFVLPPALLAAEVDQWAPESDNPFHVPALGTRYHVVVRAERPGEQEVLLDWAASWQRWRDAAGERLALGRLDADGSGAAGKRATWLGAADLANPNLMNHLKGDDVALVVLESPPEMGQKSWGRDPISAAVWAGVAVVVWARSPLADDPVALEAEVGQLLDEVAGRLPERLRARREAAAGQAGHAGGCFALMWDDADRPLPNDPLKMDVQRG